MKQIQIFSFLLVSVLLGGTFAQTGPAAVPVVRPEVFPTVLVDGLLNGTITQSVLPVGEPMASTELAEVEGGLAILDLAGLALSGLMGLGAAGLTLADLGLILAGPIGITTGVVALLGIIPLFLLLNIPWLIMLVFLVGNTLSAISTGWLALTIVGAIVPIAFAIWAVVWAVAALIYGAGGTALYWLVFTPIVVVLSLALIIASIPVGIATALIGLIASPLVLAADIVLVGSAAAISAVALLLDFDLVDPDIVSVFPEFSIFNLFGILDFDLAGL